MPIAVEALSKSYSSGAERTPALRGVDLTVETGEFVAIVGTSGSGKTTLLNVIGGLDRTYEGRVEVDGRKLSELDDPDLSRLRNRSLGFVFQHYNLLDHLTVRENVDLPAFFRRSGDSGPTPDELLRRVGLADRANSRPNRLSGGQRQRVAIARALYGAPDHILCDEPTGNLDRATGLQILAILRDLNRDDERTLIVVTHEEHVAQMARRIVRLEEGRVVSDEPNDPVEPGGSTIVGTEGAISS